MTVFTGDYKELVAALLLYQHRTIPIWLVSDKEVERIRLDDLSVINIYGVLKDWLIPHRENIGAILTMLEAGDIEVAKNELKKLLSDLDEAILLFGTISDTYTREVMIQHRR